MVPRKVIIMKQSYGFLLIVLGLSITDNLHSHINKAQAIPSENSETITLIEEFQCTPATDSSQNIHDITPDQENIVMYFRPIDSKKDEVSQKYIYNQTNKTAITPDGHYILVLEQKNNPVLDYSVVDFSDSYELIGSYDQEELYQPDPGAQVSIALYSSKATYYLFGIKIDNQTLEQL